MFTYIRNKKEKGIDMAYKVIGIQERESLGAVVSVSLKRNSSKGYTSKLCPHLTFFISPPHPGGVYVLMEVRSPT